MQKVLLAFVLFTHCFLLSASTFTPGNIVVVRVGDGSSTLTNASTAVFLDEYTPSGTLVQSIPAPTMLNGSNHALTLSGIATSEGALTLSANGQYLALAGYDTTVGYAGVASGITNRTIARVGTNGVFNTSTGYLAGSAYVTGNMRCAVTNDGNQFWTAGSGSATGGTWYVPFGSFTSAGVQTSTTITNSRFVNIFNGQLYFSTNSGGTGIYTDSTGLPTTAGQTATLLPGLPSTNPLQSPYAFILLDESPSVPGVDVMYVADDNTTSPTGGIYKFSLVGGSWVPNGNVPSTNAFRGLTGYNICSGSRLYLTASTGVYTFFDSSGYNQTITNASVNQIVITAANTVTRGIAFAPGTVAPTPPLASISASANPLCFGSTNGSINVAVTGGVTPIAYHWADGPTSPSRSNLAPGVYAVTVTDFFGCTSSVSDTLRQPAAVAISVSSKTNITCYGSNNGTITLLSSGGTAPLAYHWVTGDTSGHRIGLAPGAYTITVTDHNGCTSSTTTTLTQPAAIAITVDSIANLPCTGGSTGAITIGVTGGTGSYTYIWSNSTHAQNISGLTAGTYHVTVTDSLGCTKTDSAIVSQSGSLTLLDSVRNPTCFGLSNGSIYLSVTGGTPTYHYHWSNSDTTASISNLASGSFTVTVSDHAGCTLVRPISLTQPAALAIILSDTGASCYGFANGSALAQVSGGTQGYSYVWSGSVGTTAHITNLSAGHHTLTVTDHNGCVDTAVFSITQPDSLSLILTHTDVSTHGGNDGSVNLAVAGGTSAYSYLWSDGSMTQDLSTLPAAVYCVTVTDAHACRDSNCIAVTQPTGVAESEWVESCTAYDAAGYIHLFCSTRYEMGMTVEIYNVTGQQVYKAQSVIGSQLDLSISDASFAPGCYVIRVSADRGILCKKIAIVK